MPGESSYSILEVLGARFATEEAPLGLDLQESSPRTQEKINESMSDESKDEL